MQYKQTNNYLNQFYSDLSQDVASRCGTTKDTVEYEQVFTEIITSLLTEHQAYNIPDLLLFNASAKSGQPAAKINAWSLSSDGTELDLFLSHFIGSDEIRVTSTKDAEKQFGLLNGFLAMALNGHQSNSSENSLGHEPFHRIFESKNLLTTVRLILLTDTNVQPFDIKDTIIGDISVKHILWDIKKISQLKAEQRKPIVLDFVRDYDGAIPGLEAKDPTGEYRTFLAFFPAPTLVSIYGAYGHRLIERNVRAFLQAKGKINGGLQKTLKDEPNRFLAYNNGLSCTASHVTVEPASDGHVRLQNIRDFQIVNGGQTTASLYHAAKKTKCNISQVLVQVKITVLNDPNRISEIVPLISKYANCQNKVRDTDFHANSEYHQALERTSRAIWAPSRSGMERGTQWYYERVRGSYNDEKLKLHTHKQVNEWIAERPKSQLFTKSDLAKYLNTWEGYPHLVCKGAEKNFSDFNDRLTIEGEPIVNEQYFKQIVARAILWTAAEKAFDNLGLPQLRSQSVAYAISYLVKLSNRRINLDLIWSTQWITPSLSEALNKALRASHRWIQTPPLDQKQDQKEWAKMVACRDLFKPDLALGDAWTREFSASPYKDISTEQELASEEWEQIRIQFHHKEFTIHDLEMATGKDWVRKLNQEKISKYAQYSWDDLLKQKGIGYKKAKSLLELLLIAGKLPNFR